MPKSREVLSFRDEIAPGIITKADKNPVMTVDLIEKATLQDSRRGSANSSMQRIGQPSEKLRILRPSTSTGLLRGKDQTQDVFQKQATLT
jgi:hypothetical protein